MIKKAVLLTLLMTVFVYGCGYKMAVTGTKAAFKIYPASIENVSKEANIDHLFENEVKSYFSSINALAPQSTADYVGYVTLTGVSSSAAVKLTSGQTATFDLYATLNITVKDKAGNEIFVKSLGSRVTYNQTSSLSASVSNRNDAIKRAVRDALETFRYEFENR